MPKAAIIAIVAACAIVVVFCIGSFALDRHLLAQTYARQPQVSSPLMLTDAEIADDYPYEDVQFQLDGATLRGHVYGAENDQRGLVIDRKSVM